MVDLEKAYRIPFFKENGYIRKKCKSCGSAFWTRDKKQEFCGDSPCVEYSFIDNPITRREYTVDEMREAFLSFFERNGHKRIKRYPVIARWRDDIFLTIASIADFQPHVTSGICEPPANPLAISQPCIRLNDLDSVGKSGRHLTNFEMMGHHAFNYPDKKVYWINETVAHCNGFLRSIGVDTDLVTYKENPWSGGGNAGPALEVLSHGLELITLVFMNLKKAIPLDNDTVTIDGELYTPMDMQIVDTGYGLERLTWATQGTPTLYNAIYGDMVYELLLLCRVDLENERTGVIVKESAKLAGSMSVDTKNDILRFREECVKRLDEKGYRISVEELNSVMEPIENVCALCDHAKCVGLMLGDGIVPSNSKAGYLARLMIRRSLKLIQDLKLKLSLRDIVNMHLNDSLERYKKDEQRIEEILELEERRYRDTIDKGIRMVKREIRGGATLNDLIRFYDTHGVPPEVVKSVIDVEIPDNFYPIIAEMHSKEREPKEKKEEKVYPLKETELLFYEKPEKFQFKAKVLKSEGKILILDRTLFYPEGGGQPSDVGKIRYNDKETGVIWVEKLKNGVVLHHLDGKIKARRGSAIEGWVDRDRRKKLERNHSATHLILASARELLGKHVWQSGAQKGIDRSRLDITHYKRINREEIEKIERRANEIVRANLKIDAGFMKRRDAESRYGFRLYEGGVPKGNVIRVVTVDGIDAQACAGTHCRRTGEIGWIKILKSERVQDGVERIEFAVAESALSEFEKKERQISGICKILNVREEHLEKAAGKFFTEWKEQRKEIERLNKYISNERAKRSLERAQEYNGVIIAKDIVELDAKGIVKETLKLAEREMVVAIVANPDGNVAMARNGKVDINCQEILKEIENIGGKSGGRANLAQGTVPKANVKTGLDLLEDLVKLKLMADYME